MRVFQCFACLFYVTAAVLTGEDLPADSKQLVDKFVNFEAEELNKAKQKVEEKKFLVITVLKKHFERESRAGNRDASLALLSQIEKMDGGSRNHTQGLERMIPLAKPGDKATAAPVKVPKEAVRVGSSYYLLFADRVTRTEAMSRCKQKGGKLASVTTERLYEDYIDETRKKATFNACWTAGRFDKASKKWTWEGHTDRFSTKFFKTREDSSKPDYQFLVMDITTGQLFPKPDMHKQCFLCEWTK